MRLSILALPILSLSASVSANLATDKAGALVSWANSLVSSTGGEAQVQAQSGEVHTFESWSYVNCGLASDVVQLKSLEVSPDPPVPGKNLTVTVEADVLETIEDGALADVVVKLGLIKLLQKQFDVCEEARDNNATVQCPVQPGTYKVSQTVELPKEIPKGELCRLR